MMTASLISRSTLRYLAAVGCLLLVSGCSDAAPSEPEAFDPVGSVSFTYSGALAGSFQSTGQITEPVTSAPLQAVTGATAIRRDSLFSVMATRAAGSSRVDLFTMVLGDARGTGTFQINPLACQQQSLSTCRIALFALDVEPPSQLGGGFDPAPYMDRTYVFLQGSVTVTSYSSTRVRGTFTGTAVRPNAEGLGGFLVISNGRFDVPVQPEQ